MKKIIRENNDTKKNYKRDENSEITIETFFVGH